MSIAVITMVSGRPDHLMNQQLGLRRSSRMPDLYVVVAMADPAALDETATGPLAGTDCLIRTSLMGSAEQLPLAAARNRGAAIALDAGADELIFLDVDCVPCPGLIDAYHESLRRGRSAALHCGPVIYLPAGADASTADLPMLPGEPHRARPRPLPGEFVPSTSWNLFWSLSFAVTTNAWTELGGFHEEYAGYGAEDTDFGYRAHLAGVNLVWVGGAEAYHQYHPTSPLPVQHLDDILRNAAVFERRWGFWPMEGWLNGFRQAGLARFDKPSNRWLRC